ncbi:hypothetical protein HY642_06055 [Candidatus Woesearchaeota archaeon]|nr:hypothetical protein [Candidatus Woesearchaeota archaeon]
MARKSVPQRQKEEPADLYVSWLRNLRSAARTRIVLVQHKKEADVLKGFGVRRVVWYSEPEWKFVYALQKAQRECIVLFDVDRKSNEVCERLQSTLRQAGVRLNTRFRKVLFTSKSKELSGLLKYLHKTVFDSERKHAGAPQQA